MRFDPQRHHRRSIRLQGYDYRQAGAYFLTICPQDRGCWLGAIDQGTVTWTDAGQIVDQCWEQLPGHYPHVELDTWIVMPNHLHGILVVTAPQASVQPVPTLGQMVAFFKYQSTKRINTARGTPGIRVWQRNYYEHIIRNEASLERLRDYIVTNPLRWEQDQLHPDQPLW
jgi:REP element-mobilizing transposase RayT